jgi:acyl-CoA thioester hydrolase
MIATETAIQVPFHDIDSMGIAWHGHYHKYLEVARCELLDAIGYGYHEMAASAFSWPIIDSRIKYVKPLAFDQWVAVTSTLREWDLRIRIDYEIRDCATKVVHTRATTLQAAVDRATGDMCLPMPREFSDRVQSHPNFGTVRIDAAGATPEPGTSTSDRT